MDVNSCSSPHLPGPCQPSSGGWVGGGLRLLQGHPEGALEKTGSQGKEEAC